MKRHAYLTIHTDLALQRCRLTEKTLWWNLAVEMEALWNPLKDSVTVVPTNGRTEDAAFPGHVCAVRRYALRVTR